MGKEKDTQNLQFKNNSSSESNKETLVDMDMYKVCIYFLNFI
jgi:hypothetical protein